MLKQLRLKKPQGAGWRRRHLGGTLAVSCGVFLAIGLALSGCNRSEVKKTKTDAEEESSSQISTSTSISPPPGKIREVYATWYDIPEDSLAKRRAAPDEFTAAHNRLPLGTLVQVTHLKNGKTVKVRITDRGITSRKVKLDLCKEAAEKLEMVSKGVARVRMEILDDAMGSAPAEAHNAAPQP